MRKKIIFNVEDTFCGTLFILVLLNGLGRLAFFSNNVVFITLQNMLQFFAYIILALLIAFKLYRQKITNKSIYFYILVAIIGSILFVGYIRSGMAAFFRAFLLILVSKGIDIKKILRVCRQAYIFTFMIAVILFLLRISVGVQRRNFVSWGFTHPNVAGQILMLIVLLWIGENNELPLKKLVISSLIGGAATYILTGSRTSSISLVLLAILMPLFRFFMMRKKNIIKVFCLVHPAILLFTYISAKELATNHFFQFLDTIFVNRIFLNYYALNNVGTKLLGQNVSLTTIGTVHNTIRDVWWTTGTTVDSAYMTAILMLGIIPSIIWSMTYLLSMNRASMYRNYVLFGIAFILCFEAFSETGMIDIYCSFTLFCVVAKLGEGNYENRQSRIDMSSIN